MSRQSKDLDSGFQSSQLEDDQDFISQSDVKDNQMRGSIPSYNKNFGIKGSKQTQSQQLIDTMVNFQGSDNYDSNGMQNMEYSDNESMGRTNVGYQKLLKDVKKKDIQGKNQAENMLMVSNVVSKGIILEGLKQNKKLGNSQVKQLIQGDYIDQEEEDQKKDLKSFDGISEGTFNEKNSNIEQQMYMNMEMSDIKIKKKKKDDLFSTDIGKRKSKKQEQLRKSLQQDKLPIQIDDEFVANEQFDSNQDDKQQMGDLLTTGFGNFNVNLNKTQVQEISDSIVKDDSIDGDIFKTENRNAMIKKMENEGPSQSQKKKKKEQSLISSMVTNQNTGTGLSKENRKQLKKLKKQQQIQPKNGIVEEDEESEEESESQDSDFLLEGAIKVEEQKSFVEDNNYESNQKSLKLEEDIEIEDMSKSIAQQEFENQVSRNKLSTIQKDGIPSIQDLELEDEDIQSFTQSTISKSLQNSLQTSNIKPIEKIQQQNENLIQQIITPQVQQIDKQKSPQRNIEIQAPNIYIRQHKSIKVDQNNNIQSNPQTKRNSLQSSNFRKKKNSLQGTTVNYNQNQDEQRQRRETKDTKDFEIDEHEFEIDEEGDLDFVEEEDEEQMEYNEEINTETESKTPSDHMAFTLKSKNSSQKKSIDFTGIKPQNQLQAVKERNEQNVFNSISQQSMQETKTNQNIEIDTYQTGNFDIINDYMTFKHQTEPQTEIDSLYTSVQKQNTFGEKNRFSEKNTIIVNKNPQNIQKNRHISFASKNTQDLTYSPKQEKQNQIQEQQNQQLDQNYEKYMKRIRYVLNIINAFESAKLRRIDYTFIKMQFVNIQKNKYNAVIVENNLNTVLKLELRKAFDEILRCSKKKKIAFAHLQRLFKEFQKQQILQQIKKCLVSQNTQIEYQRKRQSIIKQQNVTPFVQQSLVEYGKGLEIMKNIFLSKEKFFIIDSFYAILADQTDRQDKISMKIKKYESQTNKNLENIPEYDTPKLIVKPPQSNLEFSDMESQSNLTSDKNEQNINIKNMIRIPPNKNINVARSYQDGQLVQQIKLENEHLNSKSQNKLSQNNNNDISIQLPFEKKPSLSNQIEDLNSLISQSKYNLKNLPSNNEEDEDFQRKLFDLLQKIMNEINFYSDKNVQSDEIDDIIQQFSSILEEFLYNLQELQDEQNEYSKNQTIQSINTNIIRLEEITQQIINKNQNLDELTEVNYQTNTISQTVTANYDSNTSSLQFFIFQFNLFLKKKMKSYFNELKYQGYFKGEQIINKIINNKKNQVLQTLDQNMKKQNYYNTKQIFFRILDKYHIKMINESFIKIQKYEKPLPKKVRKSIREFIKPSLKGIPKSLSNKYISKNTENDDIKSLKNIPSDLFLKKDQKDDLFYLNLEEDYKQKVDRNKNLKLD